ncbi:unnamed protein product, partial [Rotaria sp. Silwood1]
HQTRKKKLPNNLISSEDDKKYLPFSFDSLQKLSNQTDTNILHSLIQLDQLYPSIDKKKISNDDDDDDLISAAAIACTQMKN